MMFLVPLSLILGGAVWLPALLVASDVCGSGEGVGRMVVAASADRLCSEVLGGQVTNGTELKDLFYSTLNGTASYLPELAGYTNETDWSLPYCTLNLFDRPITFSMLRAYDEFAGRCPKSGGRHGVVLVCACVPVYVCVSVSLCVYDCAL